jgi:hypothetical protein
MAEQIHIELIDDLDGSSPAAETVSFALDGVTYDIDLNEKNAQMLRSTLAGYTQAGRAMTRAAATRREEKQKHRTRQANKAHTHEIRQAADAARRPPRPSQQTGESLHTKAEPTIAAVIADVDRSRSHTAPTHTAPNGSPVPVIAPVEFQQAT